MAKPRIDREQFRANVRASIERIGAGHEGPVVLCPSAREVADSMGLQTPTMLYYGFEWRGRVENTFPGLTVVHNGLVLAGDASLISVTEAVEPPDKTAQMERILRSMSPTEQAQALGALMMLQLGQPEE